MTGQALTEELIQQALTDALMIKGFDLTYHTFISFGSDRGFPDIFALRPGAMVAIEVKGPRGRVGPLQLKWIEMFRTIPGCVFAHVVGPEEAVQWISYDRALARILGL